MTEKTQFIKYLTRQGATIEDLNTIRARLSQVKGGKLLSATKKAAFVHTFILSDIINNPGNRLNSECLFEKLLFLTWDACQQYVNNILPI